MDTLKKRNLFLAATTLLVVIIVAVSAVILSRGPRDSSVELVERNADGTLLVNDVNDGQMTIPSFDIAVNDYDLSGFQAQNGIMAYTQGTSLTGINVNSKTGAIDWAQVAQSDVDFAMIRVGYRGKTGGDIALDSNFQANMEGAAANNIPVGVYFYSKAVTDQEAEEEATFVLEQIQTYQVTYPVAIFWEYDYNSDGTQDQGSRTISCNGEQVSGFIKAFCDKVSMAGRHPCYYAAKSFAYEDLDLSRLSGYDLWYAERAAVPGFYYDFAMWQYSQEGTVPGISGSVPMTLCLKKYD